MEEEPNSAVIDFLARILADQATGSTRTLESYQADYPGSEEAIAREYALLNASTPAEMGTTDGEPRRIGDYLLVRELGRGGQGTVWLAQDVRLDRQVALKVVPISPLFDELAPRFKREAQVTSRLEHPCICPVYDVGNDGNVAWIAMRFVEGLTLAKCISEDPKLERYPLDQRLGWIESLANALDVAHEAGVIHRDVKPANVMITPAGKPVLLDFGIARDELASSKLTLAVQALGTPAYMSPEQLGDDPALVDRRSDVWSLGVSLYEVITGRCPFEMATREALVRAVLESPAPDPRTKASGISRDLAVIVSTSLAKDSHSRYSSTSALAEDLHRLRSHEPILARPASARERLSHWARRNRALAVSLFALALVLVGALVVSLWLLSQTRRSLADVRRLSDQRLASEIITASRDLWPAVPEKEAEFLAWIDKAEKLLSRRPLHERALASLPSENDPSTSADEATTEAWFKELLIRLVDNLQRLQETRDSVLERLAWARDLERRTLDEPREEWRAAAERVASNPLYAGLVLTPQRGLVPLGRDRSSQLEEFVVLETGPAPARDERSGRLVPRVDTGLILVLLPASDVALGCEPPGPESPLGNPNIDPNANPGDGPIQHAQLDAFFISKYEMTQGQWSRHAGENPSYFTTSGRYYPAAEADAHPVENVAWLDAARVTGELGLDLPTEAQWEYAARAMTGTPWYSGEEASSLAGAANLADRYARENGGGEDWRTENWLDDGSTVHARVGSYRPNAFGLYDVAGNVSELCRDTWETWGEVDPPRPGDGLIEGVETLRSLRGGSFSENALAARSGVRAGIPDDLQSPYIGLRPMRALSTHTNED